MSKDEAKEPLRGATLNQIGIVVRDAEEAARRFSALTGMPVTQPIVTDSVDKAHTIFRGQPSPARAKLIFFNMGQVTIEFIEPLDGPSTWRDFLDRHGNGVHHIAFQVEQTAAAAAGMEAQGAKSEQMGDFTGGKYIYEDAIAQVGAVIELLQND
jgi:methylmalonyl-CoA/ethylmalonyl-CoA epimerase